MDSTSLMWGTLLRTVRPSASRQATISLRAEFLAPPARTVPCRGPFGRTTICSTVCSTISSIPPGPPAERPIPDG